MTNQEIENVILDIIDHANDFTRSDLQGYVAALVMQMNSDK